MANEYDYVVIGGGTAGCVIAARLSQAGYSVVVLEAGGKDFNETLLSPLGAAVLHETEYEYNYRTVPQSAAGGREIRIYGGKILSGSSAVNYGNWMRGHSADYDAWAERVGDQRWSYSGLLKYFKKVQTHHDPKGNPDVYGFEGPIHSTSEARKYPLQRHIYDAVSAAGIQFNPDINGGNPLGFGAFTENWKDGKRQPASFVYDLSQAEVVTNAVAANIIIDAATGTSKGVRLVDGREFFARKEVLVGCGSFRTPQLLLLSGIGPASELSKHGIDVVMELPVGENLHDHCSAFLFWKLRNPEKGYGFGSAEFMKNPQALLGNPIDWVITTPLPDASRARAAKADGMRADDPLLTQPRGTSHLMVAYAPIGVSQLYPVAWDGSHIGTTILCFQPTSRGRVTLGSLDPTAHPVIDPSYLSTEWDREALRAGFRLGMQVMLGTAQGKELVEGETPPRGHAQLHLNVSDEEIDKRVEMSLGSLQHPAGTAAMGTVVDTKCRVKGISNLRVVDASILPLPLSATYQYPVYAVAESIADLILADA